jgi:Rrf2 family protein
MKISKKCEYAINALQYLARNGGRGPIQIREIARDENIPRKFLENILFELKKRGILISIRGTGGGYQFNRDPGKVILAEVIRYIDGPVAPAPCVSRAAYSSCPLKKEKSCSLKPVMDQVRQSIADILENVTIRDLVTGKISPLPKKTRKKKVLDYSVLSMNMD